jgi:hypothetical protein
MPPHLASLASSGFAVLSNTCVECVDSNVAFERVMDHDDRPDLPDTILGVALNLLIGTTSEREHDGDIYWVYMHRV